MTASDDFLGYVRDQLSRWGEVNVRRMFGGAGLYRDGMMFGLVADDVVYFKVDDTNRDDYVTGVRPLSTFPEEGKKTVMSYYEIRPTSWKTPRNWLCGLSGHSTFSEGNARATDNDFNCSAPYSG